MPSGASVVQLSNSEVRKFKTKKKQIQTCDSGSEHRRSRSLIVHRGDGHVVLGLGDEAAQVQGGDITADFNLPVRNLIISH